MRKTILFCRIIALILLFQSSADALGAQTDTTKLSVFDYLTQEEGAKMTLETDLTTIIENKKTRSYFPASLTTADGKVFKLELRARGKYRRKIAEIPPLKMKFKKKDLVENGFDTLNEIKLVLPCFDNAAGDDLIVREYLIYRMFEQLTGASLRARLIRLTIRDTHVEKSKKTMFAIMVEDEEFVMARLKGTPVDQYGLPIDSMITNQAALVSMFQYMIGNTDWDVSMLRNVMLMRSPESGKVLVIPYDFDFSGLVAAPYASPSSESGLKSVRDRFLMANGLKPEALKRAVQIIKAGKKDIYALCRNRYLSRESAENMMQYLDSFFGMIEDTDTVPATMKAPPLVD